MYACIHDKQGRGNPDGEISETAWRKMKKYNWLLRNGKMEAGLDLVPAAGAIHGFRARLGLDGKHVLRRNWERS
jgi:hypothetical protein